MNCLWRRLLCGRRRYVLLCSRPVRCKQDKYFGTSDQVQPLYDVIVVGGGHAGTEAAAAASRMGCKTLLITRDLGDIGELQFNPSVGGIGKGHLVREIDALGGVAGRICDQSAIHYKMLNRSKIPALWGPRAHVDRSLYKKMLREELTSYKNLEIRTGLAEDLVVSREKDFSEMGLPYCQGVILDGCTVTSKAVVFCPGTFLRRAVRVGMEEKSWGQVESARFIKLSSSLEHHGFKFGKLKLGVAARILTKSVDFRHMSTLQGDESPVPFSFKRNSIAIKPEDQIPSHITVTNDDVEKFLNNNTKLFSKSVAHDSGLVSSSIEAKLSKFPGQPQQIWLEPEGLFSDQMYAEGFICMLAESQQGDILRKMQSFRNVLIEVPAHEVEYSYIEPNQLRPSLEYSKVNNLFLAGHVIGAAGYEEAAVLGLIAGINAACKVLKKPFIAIEREEAYIGVLVDDLVSSGNVDEPYKMCTNKNSFLRPDNADLRLTEKASVTGCITEQRLSQVRELQERLALAKDLLLNDVRPMSEWSLLLDHAASKSTVLKNGLHIFCLPTTNVYNFIQANPERYSRLIQDDTDFLYRLKNEGVYHITIEEQEQRIEELKNAHSVEIPSDIDYDSLRLPVEIRDRFVAQKPLTISAASCIDGVTSNDVYALLRHVKYLESKKKKHQKRIHKRSN